MRNLKYTSRKSLVLSIMIIFIISLSMTSCPEPGQTWTITFDSSGGSDVTQQQVSATVTDPTDPIKRGYLLESWCSDSSLTQAWDFSQSRAVADMTLYAKWTPNFIKIITDDNTDSDWFGFDVAISGDTAVVGDQHSPSSSSTLVGNAYIFIRAGSTWTQQAKLEADVPTSGDMFGHSVDISGDTVIIGAYQDDDLGTTNSGSAYIFTRDSDGSTWIKQDRLTASDAAFSAYFGSSVAIEGDNVIIGASGYVSESRTVGCAYIFSREEGSWSEDAKLIDNDATKSVTFGVDVDISEDTVIIGDDGGFSSGPAHAIIFRRDGTDWVQQNRLIGSSTESDISVAISLDTALISAYHEDISGNSEGSVYVFTRSNGINAATDTWSLEQKLTASDGNDYDEFGYSIDILGDTALIGSPIGDGNVVNSGCAYLFKRSGTTWTEQRKLAPAGEQFGDKIGYAVALTHDALILGARDDDSTATDSGAAFILDK